MNLDEQLLAKKQEAAETDETADTSARPTSLREAQRASAQDDSSQGATSLREAVLAEKRKEETKVAGEEEAGSAGASPMSLGTSRLLQQSWLNLIPSWGLTIIWVNIHVFLSYVLGERLFCKLGEEWASMIPGSGGAASALGSAAEPKPPVKASNECCLLAGCDLGCLFIIIAVASVIAMIVGAITSPLEALKASLGAIWGAIAGISN